MLRAFESELIKQKRLGVIIGVLGPLVAFSIASTIFQFNLAERVGPVLRNAGLQSRADLAQTEGLARVLTASAPFGGVIVVVLFATSFATEFGWGTLRNLLVRQPNRTVLLFGKFLALLDLVFVGRIVASLAAVVTAVVMGGIKNIPSEAWFSSAGLAALGGSALNLMLSALGWAGLGTLAAIVFRAPGPAVGAVLALFPVEALINGWWDQGPRWLPGELFKSVAAGGTGLSAYSRSLALTLGATILAVALSNWLFVRNDVTA